MNSTSQGDDMKNVTEPTSTGDEVSRQLTLCSSPTEMIRSRILGSLFQENGVLHDERNTRNRPAWSDGPVSPLFSSYVVLG